MIIASIENEHTLIIQKDDTSRQVIFKKKIRNLLDFATNDNNIYVLLKNGKVQTYNIFNKRWRPFFGTFKDAYKINAANNMLSISFPNNPAKVIPISNKLSKITAKLLDRPLEPTF